MISKQAAAILLRRKASQFYSLSYNTRMFATAGASGKSSSSTGFPSTEAYQVYDENIFYNPLKKLDFSGGKITVFD